MKIIAIANQKGGVGKTTTASNFASILDNRGYRTLLIDADQQGNTSDTYHAEIEGHATLYDVILAEDRIPASEAIQKTDQGEIIASDPLLRRTDEILNNDIEGVYRLQDALNGLTGYDYVIIDTGPALNKMLHSCLIASDEIIIPITADRYGVQGLANLYSTIAAVKKRQNPKLKIAGLLLVKYKERTLLNRETSDSLKKMAQDMGTKLFKTGIRESIKAREAQAVRKTLIQYAPACTTELDYEEFVNEFLKEE